MVRSILTGGMEKVSRSAMPSAATVSNRAAAGRTRIGLVAGTEMTARRKTASVSTMEEAAAPATTIVMAMPPERGMPIARALHHIQPGPARTRRSLGATGLAAAAFIRKRRAVKP
jgi:hypothetical protein